MCVVVPCEFLLTPNRVVFCTGFAARIDFNPLAVQPFRLPADTKFIVAQSLAVKNKAASNDFNTRVVECRLASQVSYCGKNKKCTHIDHRIFC